MHRKICWPDLNGIAAIQSSFDRDVVACRVEFHDAAKVRLLLLPEGMFSLSWQDPDPSADVLVALGRVIAAHSAPPSDPAQFAEEFEALADLGHGGLGPVWPDLPDVRVTQPDTRGQLSCCGLRSGGDAASLFRTLGTTIPMGWVVFSDRRPGRSLGRLVLAHATTFHP